MNSVMVPEGVMRPTLSPRDSVNQTLPSGPAVMPRGRAGAVGSVYSVATPEVVTFAILSTCRSGIHRLPSGPTVIGSDWLPVVSTEISGVGPAAGVVTAVVMDCSVD